MPVGYSFFFIYHFLLYVFSLRYDLKSYQSIDNI